MEKKTALLIILFFAVTLLATGCMMRRGDIVLEGQNPQSLSQKIKVGETSRDDIQKEFGYPRTYSTRANGDQTWIYNFVGHPFLIIRHYDRKTLSITFDNDGKVSDYEMTETHW